MMVDASYAENKGLFGGRAAESLDQTDDLNLVPWKRAIYCSYEYARYDAIWDYIAETFMTPQTR